MRYSGRATAMGPARNTVPSTKRLARTRPMDARRRNSRRGRRKPFEGSIHRTRPMSGWVKTNQRRAEPATRHPARNPESRRSTYLQNTRESSLERLRPSPGDSDCGIGSGIAGRGGCLNVRNRIGRTPDGTRAGTSGQTWRYNSYGTEGDNSTCTLRVCVIRRMPHDSAARIRARPRQAS